MTLTDCAVIVADRDPLCASCHYQDTYPGLGGERGSQTEPRVSTVCGGGDDGHPRVVVGAVCLHLKGRMARPETRPGG